MIQLVDQTVEWMVVWSVAHLDLMMVAYLDNELVAKKANGLVAQLVGY